MTTNCYIRFFTKIDHCINKKHWVRNYSENGYREQNSNVYSPICQEGQSERTFPIFAFSSRLFLFFPNFPDFSPPFHDFWQFFCCQGWHSAPHAPPMATLLIEEVRIVFLILSAQRYIDVKFQGIYIHMKTDSKNTPTTHTTPL